MELKDRWIKNVVIIGAGGFGRETAEICKAMALSSRNINLIGFIDDNKEIHKKVYNGNMVLGGFEWLVTHIHEAIYVSVSVGNPIIKKKLVKRVKDLGFDFINLIHPSVLISSKVKFGKGIIIQAGVKLAVNSQIGNHVHINFNCSIGHDAILNDYVTISPLVSISGDCEIAEGVLFGSNSSIIPLKKVGKFSKIGAGACVIKDVEAYRTAVGVPAKVKKKNIEDHHAFT